MHDKLLIAKEAIDHMCNSIYVVVSFSKTGPKYLKQNTKEDNMGFSQKDLGMETEEHFIVRNYGHGTFNLTLKMKLEWQ